SDLAAARDFYTRVLRAEVVREYEAAGKVHVLQLRIGGAMLNLHQSGHSRPLVAARPTPGAVEVCFRWNGPIEIAESHLKNAGIKIIEGPTARFASDGKEGLSVYFRDQDDNLIELLSTTQAAG